MPVSNTNTLFKIGIYFELKSVFTLESRGKSFKPLMTFSTRKIEIIKYIREELDKYNISYNVTFRENDAKTTNFYSLRIGYVKNLEIFYNLFDEYIEIKSDKYKEIKSYVMRKIKKWMK